MFFFESLDHWRASSFDWGTAEARAAGLKAVCTQKKRAPVNGSRTGSRASPLKHELCDYAPSAIPPSLLLSRRLSLSLPGRTHCSRAEKPREAISCRFTLTGEKSVKPKGEKARNRPAHNPDITDATAHFVSIQADRPGLTGG